MPTKTIRAKAKNAQTSSMFAQPVQSMRRQLANRREHRHRPMALRSAGGDCAGFDLLVEVGANAPSPSPPRQSPVSPAAATRKTTSSCRSTRGFTSTRSVSISRIGSTTRPQGSSTTGKAEVDFAVQHRNTPLPIEVKSDTRGSMKSLRILMNEKSFKLGVRSSGENPGTLDGGQIRIVPLYLIGECESILRT